MSSMPNSRNGCGFRGGSGRPSLCPRRGSRSVATQIASRIPGSPTAKYATCQPRRSSGAVPSGNAARQASTIQPPRKIPMPAPMYTPLE